jgi:phage shock protein E
MPTQSWANAGKDKDKDKEVVILDVRTPEEFKETRVIGARNIDFKNPTFKSEIEKLDKSKTYKIYCRSGNRSGKTMEMMKGMGFSDLENLGGVKEASEKLKVACEGEKPC